VLAALFIGSTAWILLGYASLIPLGAVFGWSGHPALPAAPPWIYGLIHFIALPIVCLYVGWRAAQRLAGRV
jgi:hypothetical protein